MQLAATVDIIILSFAKDEKLKNLTIQTIDTVLQSEDHGKIKFTVMVIESNKNLKPYQYPGTTTIYPDTDFGYNKFMNIGIKATSSEYICLCNNDLLFHKNWASEILSVFDKQKEIDSANPLCPSFDYDQRIKDGPNIIVRSQNLGINGILTGWCIFMRRSLIKKIGLLDERFTFWYADNDYDMTLRKYKVRHALIKTSLVEHLTAQSHDLLADKRNEQTLGQYAVFHDKWYSSKIINAKRKLLEKIWGYKTQTL